MRAGVIFNPFPGLRPFEANEDHLFFGREKEIDELLRRLRSTRFVSVVGTSGSGKSSLVRCGLISALYGGFMVQTGSTWRVAKFRPSEDPIGNLAACLNDPGVFGVQGELASTNQTLLEASLRRGSLGLVEAFRQARIPPDENLLVVVDQFEELFRFRHSRQVQNSKDEAIAFVKLLLEAAQAEDVPIYVVLTMRSDFIGDCIEYPGLPEAVNDGQYLIPRMTRYQIRSAITGPVAVAGGQITQRLVLRLLNDLGDDQDQLPVLQHALMRSWDYWYRHHESPDALVDIEDYEAVGTIAQALSLHAEEAYAETNVGRAAEIAERAFKALTDTFSDPRGVRRPTTVQQLAKICEASETEIVEVLEVFRRPGRSFLTPSFRVPLEPRSVIDISHESLMRCWGRLIRWAEDERTSAGFFVRLAQAASWFEQGAGGLWRDPELQLGLQWRQQNRPTAAWAEHHYDASFEQAMQFLDRSKEERDRLLAEQERERKKKLRQYQWAAAVLASLLVISGLLAYIAHNENRRAEANFTLAENAVNEMLSSAGTMQPRVAEDVPELEEFRRDLLEKARAFYTKFTQEKPDSLAVQEEMARAHFRLGDIDRLLVRQDAAQEYQAAIKEFKELSSKDPSNSSYRQWLANSYNWLGETLRVAGKKAEAEEAYNSAQPLQQQLVQQNSQNDQYREELARTYYNRGIERYDAVMGLKDAEAEKGLKDAEADFRSSIELLKPLAEKDPNSAAAQELGRVYNNLGVFLKHKDQLAEAKQSFEEAIGNHSRLLEHAPDNREYKQEFAMFTNNLSLLLFDERQFELAAQRNGQSLGVMEELAAPTPMLGIELANAHNARCAILLSKGAGREAEQECDLALKALQDMQRLRSFRASDNFQKAIVNVANSYADLAESSTASEQAEQRARAMAKLSRLLPEIPEKDRSELAEQYRKLKEGISTH